MTKIKLCGMMSLADIEAANELMPDFVGFVFAPKSRRYVSDDDAAVMRRALLPGIKAVGVFVNEDISHVAELLTRGIIDIAQLHGGEDEEYIRRLRNMTGAPLIKAYRIASRDDVTNIRPIENVTVMLDAGSGSGAAFCWDWLYGVDHEYFLAGGLTPENVGDAIEKFRPYGVDVSSGIETNGKKDADKMGIFVKCVRRLNREES